MSQSIKYKLLMDAIHCPIPFTFDQLPYGGLRPREYRNRIPVIRYLPADPDRRERLIAANKMIMDLRRDAAATAAA